jgi:hypothetical protein
MGPLEQELDEEFQRRLRSLPWALNVATGRAEELSDVSRDEFMNGLIALIAAFHNDVLRLAREIDASR